MAVLVVLLTFVLGPISVLSSSYDPLNIDRPSVSIITEQNGYIGLSSGVDGNVSVIPGSNGSVYLDGDDILNIIQMIQSAPPVWLTTGQVSSKTPYGYLGEFRAGQRINVGLSATDPEGMSIAYSLVAGDLPPGLSLNSNTGNITGIIPDADATYIFTARATDGHGKYADNKFRIVTRGHDGCSSNPCSHEGVCSDVHDGYNCACVRPYGGVTCNLNCQSNALGIQRSLRYVKDAQISGYNTYSTYYPIYARLNSGNGWYGEDATSYLQIDFGNLTDIYRIDTQYVSSYYYLAYFYMQYSLDGNNFNNYTDYTGTTQRLRGATSSSTRSVTLPSVLSTRFVRMFPLTWRTSYKPAFRVEMYGCYSYDKK